MNSEKIKDLAKLLAKGTYALGGKCTQGEYYDAKWNEKKIIMCLGDNVSEKLANCS